MLGSDLILDHCGEVSLMNLASQIIRARRLLAKDYLDLHFCQVYPDMLAP